ncbi:hypothetical protein [Xylophilus sp.]|uniref:hypothetical protein n=1 Tax=Xylophilus sp. TaxID=2653893 RepID=UPI0013BAAFBF|nr:hypothetical protein [Xylophilus sp.]KAF1045442.1 MAG: hypothetical protein GAK38_03038 [Xylophilus sp.]
MTAETNVSLAFYKANLALWLRAAHLLQHEQQQWLELGADLVRDGVRRLDDEARRIHERQGWQALSTALSDAGLHAVHHQAVELQAAAQTAVARQAELAEGLRQAAADWQQEAARGLSEGGRIPVAVPDLLGGWLRGWSRPPHDADAAPRRRAGPAAAAQPHLRRDRHR